jgi:hypothetical protein
VILGILNSLLTEFLRGIWVGENDLCGAGFSGLIGRIPIYTPDPDNPIDRVRQARIAALVQEMLDLHRNLDITMTRAGKDLIEGEIAATAKQIDSLVYALYGLDVAEVEMVEDMAKRRSEPAFRA